MQDKKKNLFSKASVTTNEVLGFKFLRPFDGTDEFAKAVAIVKATNGDAHKAQRFYDQIQELNEKFEATPRFRELLQSPKNVEAAMRYWTRVQRIQTFLRLFKFEDTIAHLNTSNITKFETHLVRRAVQKFQTDLRLKFKSFIFMFDIDDTVLYVDNELANLGYGVNPDEAKKFEQAVQRYFTDYPGLLDITDRTYPQWWDNTGKHYFQGQEERALEKSRNYLLLLIKHAKKVGDLRVAFNHEHKGRHSHMVGNILPAARAVLQLLADLKIPIAFTSLE